jgi:hypothetical protein
MVACTVFHANKDKSSLISIPHKAACGEESGNHNCSAISYANGLAPICGYVIPHVATIIFLAV